MKANRDRENISPTCAFPENHRRWDKVHAHQRSVRVAVPSINEQGQNSHSAVDAIESVKVLSTESDDLELSSSAEDSSMMLAPVSMLSTS
jgi:hypothetical protein